MVVLVSHGLIDGLTSAFMRFRNDCIARMDSIPGLCDYDGQHYVEICGKVLDESDSDVLVAQDGDLRLDLV